MRTKIGDDGQFSQEITLEVALQALEAFESEKVNFTKKPPLAIVLQTIEVFEGKDGQMKASQKSFVNHSLAND